MNLDLNKVYNMDCLELMKQLPDNSIDSIITDPPYGLSKNPDIVEVLTKWLAGEKYEHGSTGFMQKVWDSFVPDPSIWKECFRVLKPGGHLLSFGGTRTFDLIAIGLRLAGFEYRNTIEWIFGSGFPKSTDISKQIDKMYGAEREVVGKYEFPDGIQRNSYNDKNTNQVNIKNKEGIPVHKNVDITAPSSQEAKTWDGWGSDIKPAHEPILMFRKPLEKGRTIAKNVLKWSTGGINISGCRIPLQEYGEDKRLGGQGEWNTQTAAKHVYEGGYAGKNISSSELGRFPANLILSDDPEVQEEFAKYGKTKSGKATSNKSAYNDNSIFINGVTNENNQHGDEGSVSRFFYSAKTSPLDKNEGLDEFTSSKQINTTSKGLSNCLPSCPVHQKGLPSGKNQYSCGCDKVYDLSIVEKRNEYKNTHPTTKPTALMQYLCRLITPPNGLILDPFSGSGSTGKAAILEGFRFIGSDLESEYVDIANARIQHAIQNKDELLKRYTVQVDKILPPTKPVKESMNENKFF